MSTVAVWAAFVVILSASQGTVIVHDDDLYRTKEACEALNVRVVESIKNLPQYDDVVAFGTGCALVEVKEAPHVGQKPQSDKPAIPPPPKGRLLDARRLM